MTIHVYVYYIYMGERILKIQSINSPSWMKKHEAFLRDNKTWLLLAHARYDFLQKRWDPHEKVVWIDDFSSISGFVSWRVKASMRKDEVELYEGGQMCEVDKIRGHWKYLISEIIRENLPPDITHAKIPIQGRYFENQLRWYCQRIWEDLKWQGIIHAIETYRDGILFKLRKI